VLKETKGIPDQEQDLQVQWAVPAQLGQQDPMDSKVLAA
jgi:hypothetical protein